VDEAGHEVFRMLLSRCRDNSVKTSCWFGLSSEYNKERFVSWLEILLAEGIDINTRDRDGRTLYLRCLTSDYQPCILQKHGAKPEVVDKRGNNALHILAQDSWPRQDKMERLVTDAGLDPRSTDIDGNTLLHHVASWYNSDEKVAAYVRWLVSLGIPVNAVNKEGSSALHVYQQKTRGHGRSRDSMESVHFLDALNVQKDVNFEIRDNNGLAPVHLAVMRSGFELATLVAGGADTSFLTQDSQNVLHLSCRARQPDIVGQILDQYPSST
jgi:ankyrin repeat protein